MSSLNVNDIACGVYNLFPTQVFEFEHPDPDPLNAAISDSLYAERERDKNGLERSNFRKLGGWHSRDDLHRSADYSEIAKFIKLGGKHLSSKLGYHRRHSLEIDAMWSIINAPGSSNRDHIHPGCTWSGVYYVHAPRDSGNIEFTDPRTQNLMYQPVYNEHVGRPIDCWNTMSYTPKAGKMLIFPSWLYHHVSPNLSIENGKKAERIIISFNITQRPNTFA